MRYASYPAVIGVCGEFGSGKDEVANIMSEAFGYARFAFGDDVKMEEARVLLDENYRSFLWDTMPESTRDAVLTCLALGELDPFGKPTSPDMRELHQQYGTEFRRGQDPDYWVNLTEHRFKSSKAARIFFSDVRFPNEETLIRRYRGQLWRVTRDAGLYQKSYDIHLIQHVSERNLARLVPDVVIDNRGSLDDLRRNVHQAMRNLRLRAA